MSFHARSPPDIAALESCFVTVKASPNFNAKAQGAGLFPNSSAHVVSLSTHAKAQSAAGFSHASSIDARSSTPDVSGRFGATREVFHLICEHHS